MEIENKLLLQTKRRYAPDKGHSAVCCQQTISVPPIQPVNGRVVFFRKGREKISTLEPLTSWIFAVAFRRRKRRTG